MSFWKGENKEEKKTWEWKPLNMRSRLLHAGMNCERKGLGIVRNALYVLMEWRLSSMCYYYFFLNGLELYGLGHVVA